MKVLYRYIRVLVIRWLVILRAKRMNIPDSLLIIAPHPDDEVFGCAGLIQRALLQGKNVNVIVLTNGENAYDEELISKQQLKEKRKSLTVNAAKKLNLPIGNIHCFGWRDGYLHNEIRNEVKRSEIRELIERINPEVIFSPHPFEGWEDHLAASDLADALITTLPAKNIQSYKYCVWLWYSTPYSKVRQLDWKNSYRLNLTQREHKLKLEAIDAYMKPQTDFGKPYAGDLPTLFVWANQWRRELYFKVKAK